jgi:hypothetical protein
MTHTFAIVSLRQGGAKKDVSWEVACGANVAYDQFPSQNQVSPGETHTQKNQDSSFEYHLTMPLCLHADLLREREWEGYVVRPSISCRDN